MREIILNFKKEYNKFFKRDYMIRWLFKLFAIVAIFTFLDLGKLEPYYSLLARLNVPEELRRVAFNLFTVSFFVTLIPNNATIDTILGEKKNNTMETLMTIPMSILNIFLGKMLFIMFLSFNQLIVYIVLVNLITYFIYDYTFFTYFTVAEVTLYFISVVCTLIVCSMVGVILSLINNNVKAIGYINGFIGLILISMALREIVILTDVSELTKVIYAQLILIFALGVVLSKNIKKSTVMKYVKY